MWIEHVEMRTEQELSAFAAPKPLIAVADPRRMRN